MAWSMAHAPRATRWPVGAGKPTRRSSPTPKPRTRKLTGPMTARRAIRRRRRIIGVAGARPGVAGPIRQRGPRGRVEATLGARPDRSSDEDRPERLARGRSLDRFLQHARESEATCGLSLRFSTEEAANSWSRGPRRG